MNHCIPNRILWPPGDPIYNGLVVTSPLEGRYTHYVFRDSTLLFAMPAHLFRCQNTRGMKKTQIMRQEKFLEFGDNLYFTADPRTQIVLDYEKNLKVHETECRDGLNLVRTIAVLPPPTSMPRRLWTELFGDIDLTLDKWGQLHQQAKHDVPLFVWISVNVDVSDQTLNASFYEFIEVAINDRKIASETDWNANNPHRVTTLYNLETTDEEEEENDAFIQKNDDQILNVIVKLEGYLIGQKELYCPKLKDHCVEIGLWAKHLAKSENLTSALGNKFRFDAYFSDILQIYIAYHHEDITESEGEEKECAVALNEDDPSKTLIQIQLFLTDTFGPLYNTQFGLIADPNHVLSPLPHVFGELEIDDIWVNVVDTGPGKKLSRFAIADLDQQVNIYESDDLPFEIIEQAKDLAEEDQKGIVTEGFIIDSHGTFLAPNYANLHFDFPQSELANYPPGQWAKIQALYKRQSNCYHIVGGERIRGKPPVPHTTKTVVTEDGSRLKKYLFEIDASIIKDANNQFVVGQLYNPEFGGIIGDPDGKFVRKKRVKKYKVVVEAAQRDQQQFTPFTLVRMAGEDARNGEDGYGLEMPEELDEDEREPVTQADFLSRAAIRDREMESRKRRRKRNELEKQLREQQRQLEEEIDENGGESSTNTAAPTAI